MPYIFSFYQAWSSKQSSYQLARTRRCGQTEKDMRKKSNFVPEYGINVIDIGFILNGAQIIEFSTKRPSQRIVENIPERLES